MSQFVPQGRSVFSNVADGELDNHFDRLVTAATDNQGALGALGTIILQRATALRDGWATIYNATRAAKGTKTSTIEEKNAARTALQWELYVNLQTITQLFPRDESKIEVYMRQSLLGFTVPSVGGGGGTGGGSEESSEVSESDTSELESTSEFETTSDSESSFPSSSTSSEFIPSSSSDFSSSSDGPLSSSSGV